MANDLAVRLDQEATGGDVVYRGRRRGRRAAGGHGDVRPAHSRDRRLPLECAKQSLSNHDVTPDSHVNLAAEGVPKEYHTDYDDELAEELFEELVREVDRAAHLSLTPRSRSVRDHLTAVRLCSRRHPYQAGSPHFYLKTARIGHLLSSVNWLGIYLPENV